MPPKRRASSTETENSTGSRNMKQRRLENPNPVLSEGRDVLISLGPRSFKVRKADLRDNSAYFAEFPDDQFPKRFTLVPGGDVDDVVGWRLLPKGTSEDDGATTEEDRLDNDTSKQACEVHEVILGLMCPPLQYSHLLRSERSAFIISISKRIAAYGCTSEVNDTFIGKILTANISANLFDIDPCLLLQIANNLKHEELFSTAMPHVVGRFCIFREEVQEMPVKLQRCVAAHVEAFQDEILSLRSKIEDCLAIPEKPSTIFAAHLIRRHFIYRHDYVVFLEDATHPTVFEALRDLCNLQDVGSAVSYSILNKVLNIERGLSAGLEVAAENGWNEDTVQAGIGEDLRHNSVKLGVKALLGEIGKTVDLFFKDGHDRGFGYFSPPCKGSFPWQTDAAGDSDTSTS